MLRTNLISEGFPMRRGWSVLVALAVAGLTACAGPAATKADRVVINVQDLLGVKDDVNVHVWYEPGTIPKVADAVTAALSKLDPQNASYFSAQKERYLTSYKAVTDKIAALKAKYPGV